MRFKEERFIVNFVKEKTARTTMFSECTHHFRSFSHITQEKENLFSLYIIIDTEHFASYTFDSKKKKKKNRK